MFNHNYTPQWWISLNSKTNSNKMHKTIKLFALLAFMVFTGLTTTAQTTFKVTGAYYSIDDGPTQPVSSASYIEMHESGYIRLIGLHVTGNVFLMSKQKTFLSTGEEALAYDGIINLESGTTNCMWMVGKNNGEPYITVAFTQDNSVHVIVWTVEILRD